MIWLMTAVVCMYGQDVEEDKPGFLERIIEKVDTRNAARQILEG